MQATWLYFIKSEKNGMEFLGTHQTDELGIPKFLSETGRKVTVQDVTFPKNMLLGETFKCYVMEFGESEFVALTGKGVETPTAD